jgi:hypothetical protein
MFSLATVIRRELFTRKLGLAQRFEDNERVV